MPPRQRQRDLGLNTRLRPASSPVDTYYRPTEEGVAQPDRQEGLQQLAQSLDSFGKSVDHFAQSEHKIYTEAELAAGQRARQQNQGSWRELVSKGLVPEGANPWFKQGFDTQEGRLLGHTYDTSMRTEWAQSPVKDLDNPGALAQWMAEFNENFSKSNLAGRSPAFFDGFSPMVERSHTNLSAQHTAFRQTEISRKVRENTYREVDQLAREEALAGSMFVEDAAARGARLSTRGAIIGGRLQAMVANGLPGSEANQIATDAIVNLARETRDPGVLQLLDHIPTRDGAKLSGTKYAKEERQKAELWITDYEWGETRKQWALDDRPHSLKMQAWAEENIDHARKEREYTKTTRDRAEETRAALSLAVITVMQNPARPINPAMLEELGRLDPSAPGQVSAFREAMLTSGQRIVEDRRTVMQIMADMARNPSAFDVGRLWAGPVSRTFDVERSMSMYATYRALQGSERVDGLAADPIIKGYMDALEKGITNDIEGKATGAGGFDAEKGVIEFRFRLLEWHKQNPQAGQGEFYKAARETANDIFKSYSVAPGLSKSLKKDEGGESPQPTANDPAAGGKTPPKAHIDYLKKNPWAYADFDAKYGAGAAQRYLRGK